MFPDSRITIFITLILVIIVISYYNSEPFYSLKTDDELIDEINASRGTLGTFYVDCPPCGRGRIIEDKEQKQQNDYDTYMMVAKLSKYSCGQKPSYKPMSYYSRYIDNDVKPSYNGLMSNPDNERFFIKNYIYWPDIDDPVNGPPAI